jgi:hypothetical protein
MTRDEYRAKCIEAMADLALAGKVIYADENPKELLFTRDNWIVIMTAAFDALRGIARVNPIEATEEMHVAAKERRESDKAKGLPTPWGQVWKAMSTTGDLTKTPESR